MWAILISLFIGLCVGIPIIIKHKDSIVQKSNSDEFVDKCKAFLLTLFAYLVSIIFVAGLLSIIVYCSICLLMLFTLIVLFIPLVLVFVIMGFCM